MVTRIRNVLAFTKRKDDLHKQAMNVLANMLRELNFKVAVVTENEGEYDITKVDTLLLRSDIVLVTIDSISPFVTVDIIGSEKETSAQGALLFRFWDEKIRKIDILNIIKHLASLHRVAPLWACILIGGKSTRMGRPKHLLPHHSDKTWLEECVQRVQPHVENIILSGAGFVPESLAALERVEDALGMAGPLGGIIGVSRAYPEISWLLFACDMPLVSKGAIEWLIEQRNFGHWAIVPQRTHVNDERVNDGKFTGRDKKGLEPLFACYERQCGPLFEEIIDGGSLRIRDIVKNDKVSVVTIPDGLEEAWTNINTPDDLN